MPAWVCNEAFETLDECEKHRAIVQSYNRTISQSFDREAGPVVTGWLFGKPLDVKPFVPSRQMIIPN